MDPFDARKAHEPAPVDPSAATQKRTHPAAEVPRPLRLSWGQRNSIAALLREVADALGRLEHLLGTRLDTPLRFVVPSPPPTPAARTEVMRLANVLAQRANLLADLVGVTLPAQPVGQTVAGQFSVLWSDVEEIAPERLRDYGPVAPETSQALQHPIAEMAQLSLAISRVAGRLDEPAAAPTPPSPTNPSAREVDS